MLKNMSASLRIASTMTMTSLLNQNWSSATTCAMVDSPANGTSSRNRAMVICSAIYAACTSMSTTTRIMNKACLSASSCSDAHPRFIA